MAKLNICDVCGMVWLLDPKRTCIDCVVGVIDDLGRQFRERRDAEIQHKILDGLTELSYRFADPIQGSGKDV